MVHGDSACVHVVRTLSCVNYSSEPAGHNWPYTLKAVAMSVGAEWCVRFCC